MDKFMEQEDSSSYSSRLQYFFEFDVMVSAFIRQVTFRRSVSFLHFVVVVALRLWLQGYNKLGRIRVPFLRFSVRVGGKV